MCTALRWTIEELLRVQHDAVRLAPNVDVEVRSQVSLAQKLLDLPPLAESSAVRPTRLDLRALSRQGHPWNVVASVAAIFVRVETSLHEYARRLIYPDDELRWRLFHLGVLGELILALRKRGAVVTSVRPIARASSGPAYRVGFNGSDWDLWFEAGGAWSHYGRESPFVTASSPLPRAAQPLSPDLLLIRLDEMALIVECKYSLDADYVARGVAQVLGYATEARSRLSSSVLARVVAPNEVIETQVVSVDTVAGSLGLCLAADLEDDLELLGFT
jgi:hypothetical protein